MTKAPFRSPFAALVWKEWRESWWLFVLVAVAPAAWCAIYDPFATGADTMTVLLALLICALALALGAGLFAGERARGAAAFRNELPLARGSLWNAKLFLPLMAVLCGTVLYALACLHGVSRSDAAGAAFWLIFWLLSFASAVFCSVLLDRTVTAFAAGFVVAVVLALGQALLLPAAVTGVNEANGPSAPFIVLLLVEAIALYWLSRVAYVRQSD